MFDRPLVSIDIGSSSVKVIELTGGSTKQLRAIGLETLPPGTVNESGIEDLDALESTLKELLDKLKINTTGRRASLSLGGNAVMIKKIGIATSNDVDLSEQVFFEAEQQFQADMEDIYFDHFPMPSQEPGKVDVLLVGARREMVEQYIQMVRGCGMRVGVIECDVFSTANMFEYNYGVLNGLVALVNIGASMTQVSLVNNGEYLYTRDIPLGGEEYSRQVMENLGVDRDNAETLKVAASLGEATSEDLQRLLGEINEQLVAEIQMTIDFFYNSGEVPGDAQLSCLFMTGGGSRTLGLDAALAAAMGIQVQIANPFQRIEVNPSKFQLDYITMQGHLYGVAVGLGLRSLQDRSP